MYYLFYNPHSGKMIQLTFTDGIVTTHTDWERNEIPTEFSTRVCLLTPGAHLKSGFMTMIMNVNYWLHLLNQLLQ